MPDPWLRMVPLQRWLTAAAVIVLTVMYGELCLRQRQGSVDLGVQTTQIEGQVVVSRVQPAGLAWAAGIRPGDRVVTDTKSSCGLRKRSVC
jgi:predicted metalloprotease with PDZ domain